MRAKTFFWACAGLFLLALSYHLGAGRANAQSGIAPEVAVLSGTLPDGGTIPLPHYADGTEASEGECKWIASIHTASGSTPNFNGVWCYTTGRVVSVGAASNCPCPPGVANYLIIATRVNGPVGTVHHTIGELKARYR